MARRKPKGRPVTGILLLDKPEGCSSNGALQDVKRLYQARKAGHTGSLDPLASGMLPLCFGEATKISGYLLDADKRYWVRAKLGIKTDTADSQGEVIEEKETSLIKESKFLKTLKKFKGDVQQTPPMYSALKHKGKRLYELAREGVEVERKPRDITIHELDLVSLDADSFELELRCSKGTYVRTLVEDIAAELGQLAHVTALRRTHVGPFGPDQMQNMESLLAASEHGLDALDSLLLPLESAFGNWHRINLPADTEFYFLRGEAVQVPGAPTQGRVAVFNQDRRMIGIGEIDSSGRIAPRRLFKLKSRENQTSR